VRYKTRLVSVAGRLVEASVQQRLAAEQLVLVVRATHLHERPQVASAGDQITRVGPSRQQCGGGHNEWSEVERTRLRHLDSQWCKMIAAPHMLPLKAPEPCGRGALEALLLWVRKEQPTDSKSQSIERASGATTKTAGHTTSAASRTPQRRRRLAPRCLAHLLALRRPRGRG
jgi:hypothetical protein